MSPALTGTDGTPLRVLVVESNPAPARVLDKMLSSFGCAADVVADGNEALAMFQANRYDCVVMCQRPFVDGLETARAIRQYEPDADRVHIVGVALDIERDDEHAARDAFDYFLDEPVRADELAAALRRAAPEPSSYALVPPIELAVLSDAALLDHVEEFLREMMELPETEDVSDIVDEFLDGGRARMAELRGATDAMEIAGAAHALKGSLSYLGIGELTAMCRTIEKNAVAGRLDEVPHLIEQAGAVIARIEAARRARG